MASSVLVSQHDAIGADGVRLKYWDYRPEAVGTGDPVVLVHGLASASVQFERTARHLAEQRQRVIVPDLRGHGQSGVPEGAATPDRFSIPLMAEDILRILDAAGAERVHWVGNSLGGILALSLLGTPARQRLATLALFGTCFSLALPHLAAGAVRWPFALVGQAATARLTALTTTGDKAGRLAIKRAIEQFNPAAGVAVAHNVRAYDFTANALAYEGPMLLMRGGKDRAVNLGLRRDLPKFIGRPNFRLVELPLGGHCANLDVHEQFCAALEDFWAANAMIEPR